MPNPNAILSSSIRFIPPLDRAPAEMLRAAAGLSVELDNERIVRLDPANPLSAGFVQILDGLSRQGIPVYLEIDPSTSAITRLYIPYLVRVAEIEQTADGLTVKLEPSQALHRLPLNHPDFPELEGELRRALQSGQLVLVTEDDAHNIIDVRPFTPGPGGPVPPFPKPKIPPPRPKWLQWLWRLFHSIWWWHWWPWWWFRCVSSQRAQQIFNAMKATSCDPLAVPAPCIPFLYPDDGCWGRAHEMCRLMINMGLSPRKVWIEASTRLHVDTKNNPNCFVEWGWHVAPTLCVRGPGFFKTREMVIDPSLFNTPVSKATWKNVQNDPNATLTNSAASIFFLWGNVTDPTNVQTNQVLANYRLQLQNRSLQHGPPPYASCP